MGFESDLDDYDFYSQNNDLQCKYYTTQEYNNLFNKNYLSMINSNVRSFNCNFDTLNSVFSIGKLPSIFCLTETRFTSSTVQEISGYKSYHIPRSTDTPYGGISLFALDSLKAKKIPALSYSNNTIEISSIEFDFGKQHVVVLGVYRPHSDSIINFNILFSPLFCTGLNNSILF